MGTHSTPTWLAHGVRDLIPSCCSTRDILTIAFRYMLNPGEWDWGNYAGFFWAGACFFSIIYTYYRVPEPRGRTYAEMDMLFDRKVSARKFAKAEVNAFEEHVEGGAIRQFERKVVEGQGNEGKA